MPALVDQFLRAAASRSGQPRDPVPPDVLAMLANHDWPGNVRELKNFVDRFRVFSPETAAQAAELLDPRSGAKTGGGGGAARYDLPYKDAKAELVEAFEVEYCRRALARSGGNISAAARESGIHRKYLEELVKKHALK